MKFVLDTNILIFLIKNESFGEFFKENYQKDTQNEIFYIFASLGELDSISLQNKWGEKKKQTLNQILKGFRFINQTNRELTKAYAKIDAFSQGKLEDNPLPKGLTSRNMGKNDLWISAVAYVLEATLITTDKDFDHLNPSIIKIDYIDIQRFQ